MLTYRQHGEKGTHMKLYVKCWQSTNQKNAGAIYKAVGVKRADGTFLALSFKDVVILELLDIKLSEYQRMKPGEEYEVPEVSGEVGEGVN